MASLRPKILANLLRGSAAVAIVALILSPPLLAVNLGSAAILALAWIIPIAASWRLSNIGRSRAAAVVFVASAWLTLAVPAVLSPARLHGGSMVATLLVALLVLPTFWAAITGLLSLAAFGGAVALDAIGYSLPVIFPSSNGLEIFGAVLLSALVLIAVGLNFRDICPAIRIEFSEFLAHWVSNESGAKPSFCQRESQAAKSERRYRSLFESAMDCIIVIDRNGQIVDLNHRVSVTLGYVREELLGKPLAYVLDAQLMSRMYPRPADILTEHRTVRGEQELRAKDGTIRFAEFVASPLPDGNVLAIVRDITERKRAADAIKALNEALERRIAERTAELQEANQELQSFSHTVAHDLRAPLRCIAGFTTILRAEHGAALAGEPLLYLERINRNALRMQNMIDDLLRFAENVRGTLETTTVDMRSIVDAVLEDHLVQWGNRAKFEIGDLPQASGDPGLIREVWCNLVGNALKYSSKVAQPHIRIGGTTKGEMAEFWITDNGVGFDMAYADKLFAAFQRLHPANEFEGSGIGLATVERIVHRHGGKLRAYGQEGEGATFVFSLPAATHTDEVIS
jgi:PAS domain S-box-containing protein